MNRNRTSHQANFPPRPPSRGWQARRSGRFDRFATLRSPAARAPLGALHFRTRPTPGGSQVRPAARDGAPRSVNFGDSVPSAGDPLSRGATPTLGASGQRLFRTSSEDVASRDRLSFSKQSSQRRAVTETEAREDMPPWHTQSLRECVRAPGPRRASWARGIRALPTDVGSPGGFLPQRTRYYGAKASATTKVTQRRITSTPCA
jgi:hypothetical protein